MIHIFNVCIILNLGIPCQIKEYVVPFLSSIKQPKLGLLFSQDTSCSAQWVSRLVDGSEMRGNCLLSSFSFLFFFLLVFAKIIHMNPPHTWLLNPRTAKERDRQGEEGLSCWNCLPSSGLLASYKYNLKNSKELEDIITKKKKKFPNVQEPIQKKKPTRKDEAPLAECLPLEWISHRDKQQKSVHNQGEIPRENRYTPFVVFLFYFTVLLLFHREILT